MSAPGKGWKLNRSKRARLTEAPEPLSHVRDLSHLGETATGSSKVCGRGSAPRASLVPTRLGFRTCKATPSMTWPAGSSWQLQGGAQRVKGNTPGNHRTSRKNDRTSSTNSSGCSKAAKCPPRAGSFQ
jgi:hypothetical protein